MRIYTRGGDEGKTTLIGGERRSKDDVRVEAYGSVDEAGAVIGMALSYLEEERDADIREILEGTAQRLWDVGADLAAPNGAKGYAFRTSDDAASSLEPYIDKYQEESARLTKFILRGGSKASSALHMACTVVRRAERRTVALMNVEPIHMPALRYLNRLSDLLFVLARAKNAREAVLDVPYTNSTDVFRG